VVHREDYLHALRALCPLDPQVRFAEDGSVNMWLPGIPVSSNGASFEVVGHVLIDALRDYAVTWVADLRRFANHQDQRYLVDLAARLRRGLDGQ
jgi:hypothetical protein